MLLSSLAFTKPVESPLAYPDALPADATPLSVKSTRPASVAGSNTLRKAICGFRWLVKAHVTFTP